jgi:hypothetical protein
MFTRLLKAWYEYGKRLENAIIDVGDVELHLMEQKKHRHRVMLERDFLDYSREKT